MPITDRLSSKRGPYDTTNGDSSRTQYMLGPSVEFQFSPRFAFEVNALFERIAFDVNYSYAGQDGGRTQVFNSTAADRWTIPLLAKYRFAQRGAFRPFASLGGAISIVDRVRGGQDVVLPDGSNVHGECGFEPREHVSLGVVAGAGVELGTGRLRFIPEFRYTRWTYRQYDFGGVVRSNRNQVDFLLGFRF